MYHGDESGHLIFFVNSNIIMIEFSQTETKSYNFYIENQLIELNITKENSEYDYELTPQKMPELFNEEKIFTKHFWIPLIMLIIALNLLVMLLMQL